MGTHRLQGWQLYRTYGSACVLSTVVGDACQQQQQQRTLYVNVSACAVYYLLLALHQLLGEVSALAFKARLGWQAAVQNRRVQAVQALVRTSYLPAALHLPSTVQWHLTLDNLSQLLLSRRRLRASSRARQHSKA